MSRFGIVIPAYNEAENLARVLEPVCSTDWLSEIIVVDDGSQDDTCAVVQRFSQHDPRVSLIRLAHNQGKAGAMLAGVRQSQSDYVIFLDADLVGLRPEHLRRLRDMVLAQKCDMVVAVFRHGRLHTDLSHFLVPILSGQRCLRRVDVERALSLLVNSRYGVETGITCYAKAMGWRSRYVVWNHVTHVIKEFKLGYWLGLRARWRMYRQIFQTVLFVAAALGSWSLVWRGFQGRVFSWRFAAATVLVLFAVWFTTYDRLAAYTELHIRDLATWQPEDYQRILIFAPHPDDEVLASGGVIGGARLAELPAEVRVVVATNGDASSSTAVLNGYNPISQTAYRRIAQMRQQESIQALQTLGVPAENIMFLGFPDRGLEAIWQRHWLGDTPFYSRYTGLSQSSNSLNAPNDLPYTGSALLGQIRQILADFNPDAIILPHFQDAHADHRALANFVVLAVALNQAEGLSSPATLFSYVMWLNTSPRAISVRLDRDVQRLPVRFDANPADWVRYSLAAKTLANKSAALRSFQSQSRGLRTLFSSANAHTEIFNRLLLHQVPLSDTPPSFPPDVNWQSLPHRDGWVLPGARQLITSPNAAWVTADSNGLWFALRLPRLPTRSVRYTLAARTVVDGENVELRVAIDQFVQRVDGTYAMAYLPLDSIDPDLNNPIVMLSVDTTALGRSTVARSDWQLLRIIAGE